ncbi:MAG: translation initiation factor IF-2, partial [Coriobacteriales bacterium]|nr:translation initiation factor IF-2 [Coriobacteriales bacterium]
LAKLLNVPGNEIVKRLMLLGTPLTLTQTMSDDLVELIAGDLGAEIAIVSQEEEMSFHFHDEEKDLKPRPPVVTVMGHVDHGKTSLLDAIRATGVVETEAGGITQHIGASVVFINGNQITFIDTPGHEAFTAMRARGAQVTDVIVLVVAADDGVMPQTIEAINHAKAAKVPIVVAINKIDKDGANPDRVRNELSEHGVISEEWGGDNMFVEVSAKQNLNIDELLETIILQADVLELKANPDTTASGFVIEANLDKGRGPVATVIVQRGTLRVGDYLVAGTCHGRVRALVDPKGNKVDVCKPSDPVEILGLNSVPGAGDEFAVFEDDGYAKKLANERETKQRLASQEKSSHVSLDNLFARMEQDKLAELNLIVKADVQGSIEALRDALQKMDQSEVRINIIHEAVGGITKTDVTFAAASDAIIIGFGVRPQASAKVAAEKEKVDIRLYKVIYQAIDDINAARVGLLAPEEVEIDSGIASIRETFKMPKVGTIAGCLVEEGVISATDNVRVVRDGVVIYDGKMASLRHYRDDVSEVKAGTECGIGLVDFQDIKPGDEIEAYRIEKVARKE